MREIVCLYWVRAIKHLLAQHSIASIQHMKALELSDVFKEMYV
jgi:hypothetical protein